MSYQKYKEYPLTGFLQDETIYTWKGIMRVPQVEVYDS